jgi:uncharacterized protein YbjT (DUF2867 family)
MKQTILIAGATGYIGGRLAPRLLEAGYNVRCLVRDPARLHSRPWAKDAEIVRGDLLRTDESLDAALNGVEIAYYLVHSLHKGDDYAENDLTAARHFASAAQKAGVKRIIYLGQLGQPEGDESPYIRSRHAVGDALRESGVPVTEFRAGVIVGSGSVTFEMIRDLTERWPFLVCPLWAYTFSQPIAVRDVLAYLTGTLEQPASAGKIIDIGGPDQLTYAEMLLGYSVERGLARWMIPVRLMTPGLSAWWTHLITSIPASVARPLIESMVSNAIVSDTQANDLFPEIRPITYHQAVRFAMARLDSQFIESSWSDALVSSLGEDASPFVMTSTEGFLLERRQITVNASPEACYRSFTSLGGDVGWLYMDWAWEIRGWMDRLSGGVGIRRGRRHPTELRVGDALDFWRVEALEENRFMRLRAEMIVPGKAWLEFQVEPLEGGKARLTQTAWFEPFGLYGFLYWYSLFIPHIFIFGTMIRKVGERAEKGLA